MASIATTADIQPLAGLLAGLRLALQTANRVGDQDLLCRVADWRAVARLATHHRVAALLLQGLRSNGLQLPDPTAELDLAAQRQRDVLRGMRQLGGMRRAVAGLAVRGIPALVLKGLPLGQRLYGNPFAKSSIDIDLLVSPKVFVAAGRTLCDLGWRRSMPSFRETPARTHWYDALEKEHVFVGPGGTLELHRRLLGNRYLFDPSFTSLHANAGTVEIGGYPYRTLGDVDQLLYLACHGSLHYWQRLKWLCDFAAFLGAIDDDALKSALARGSGHRFRGAIVPALLLCREALHVEPPAAAVAVHDEAPRTRFVVAVSRRAWTPCDGLRAILREAVMRIGKVFIGSGIRYIRHEMRGFLIQPYDFDRIDLPDRLFWFYFPLRPVLWMVRVLRRQTE